MNKYLEKDIEDVRDTLKVLRSTQRDLQEDKDKNYRVFEILPNEFNPDRMMRRIWYYKAIIEVAEYYQEKLGDRDHFDFGKYSSFSLDICFGRIRFGVYLSDDETEGKLYDYIFGSHSGINEWYEAHITQLITLMFGETNYSHAFGSHDLTDIIHFFKNFGQNKDGLYWEYEKFENDVKHAKKIIDWLDNVSTNHQDLIKDFDEVLDLYFAKVFKYNNNNE